MTRSFSHCLPTGSADGFGQWKIALRPGHWSGRFTPGEPGVLTLAARRWFPGSSAVAMTGNETRQWPIAAAVLAADERYGSKHETSGPAIADSTGSRTPAIRVRRSAAITMPLRNLAPRATPVPAPATTPVTGALQAAGSGSRRGPASRRPDCQRPRPSVRAWSDNCPPRALYRPLRAHSRRPGIIPWSRAWTRSSSTWRRRASGPATATIIEIGAVRLSGGQVTGEFFSLVSPGARRPGARRHHRADRDHRRDGQRGAARHRRPGGLPDLRQGRGARRPQRAVRHGLPDRAACRGQRAGLAAHRGARHRGAGPDWCCAGSRCPTASWPPWPPTSRTRIAPCHRALADAQATGEVLLGLLDLVAAARSGRRPRRSPRPVAALPAPRPMAAICA